MVDRQHLSRSLVRQCRSLDISRSGVCSRSSEASQEDLDYMKLMDRQYLATPFYGSRRFTVWLSKQVHYVNRKRVRPLMRIMGLKAIYRRPRTSKATPGHMIYQAQSGLGSRYHLGPHGTGLPVPGSHHGLVQPIRGLLASLRYSGRGLLC